MNRQVPVKAYTIIGAGRIARHIKNYFDLTDIQYQAWNRNQSPESLRKRIDNSDVVLLLISDNAIEPFFKKYLQNSGKPVVHFSGSVKADGIFGFHPLMTFSNDLYDLPTYQSVPFVSASSDQFQSFFPQLSNHCYSAGENDMSCYHALCVIAGNFTSALMREVRNRFTDELNLPENILFPYLLQTVKNFVANPDTSATGPLVRGDVSTIEKHLHCLKGDKLEDIYQSFLKLHEVEI